MSTPPAGLIALIERFDPDVIDVPGGSARIRLAVHGEGEWDAVIEPARSSCSRPATANPTRCSAPTRRPGRRSPATCAAGWSPSAPAACASARTSISASASSPPPAASADERRLRFDSVHTRVGKISTLSAGEGDPVICLHGLGGTKASFLPTVAALADHHRVIAMDLPGFGDSDKPLAPPMTRPTSPGAIGPCSTSWRSSAPT